MSKFLDNEGLEIVWQKAKDEFDQVSFGYYDGLNFYANSESTILILGLTNKIYLDIPSQTLYSYNGEKYIPINQKIEWKDF